MYAQEVLNHEVLQNDHKVGRWRRLIHVPVHFGSDGGRVEEIRRHSRDEHKLKRHAADRRFAQVHGKIGLRCRGSWAVGCLDRIVVIRRRGLRLWLATRRFVFGDRAAIIAAATGRIAFIGVRSDWLRVRASARHHRHVGEQDGRRRRQHAEGPSDLANSPHGPIIGVGLPIRQAQRRRGRIIPYFT